MTIKSSRLLFTTLLVAFSANTHAWWGGSNGLNCWPVWTPMYWMEEMDDFSGSDFFGGSGPYGYWPYGYSAPYGAYGYGPYGYPPGGYGYPGYSLPATGYIYRR